MASSAILSKYEMSGWKNQQLNWIWLRGQAVKTLASHAGIRGSIPRGVT